MTKRRIKAKANAMEEADVHYISLVTRPASRIPFRLTKSEDDDPETEAGLMINLSRMFKRDGEAAAPKGIALVGVVLQKAHEAHFAPQLEKLGLKIDDRAEQDEAVVLKQADFKEDEVIVVKHGEVAGIYANAPEAVRKAFDPYQSSDDFDENMAMGFLPGMSMATEALFDTVVQVLRTAESPEDAKGRIESNIDKYKSAVLDMASNLPVMAFKLESLNLEGFEPVEKTDGGEGGDDAAAADAAAAAAAASASSGGGDDAAAGAAQTTQKSDGDAAAAAAADPNALLTDDEKKKLKGVHIEDLDMPAGQQQKAKSDDGTADAAAAAAAAPTATSDESDKGENALTAALQAFKSEVLEAISSVKAEVTSLKSKHDELAGKVKEAATKAEAARKAVKGTVPSNSDTGPVRDESLGIRSRKGEASADEKTWGGTSLDRIVGDFPQASGQ